MPHWLKCWCTLRLIRIVIHVCDLIVRSLPFSSPCSLPCVSPISSSFAWTLTFTPSSSMWTSSRQDATGIPRNEESGALVNNTPRTHCTGQQCCIAERELLSWVSPYQVQIWTQSTQELTTHRFWSRQAVSRGSWWIREFSCPPRWNFHVARSITMEIAFKSDHGAKRTLACLTIFISRNSSQSVDTQSNSSRHLSLPYLHPTNTSDDGDEAPQSGRLPQKLGTTQPLLIGKTKPPLQSHQHMHTENAGEIGGTGGIVWKERVLEPPKY